jgi:hypothetical protein
VELKEVGSLDLYAKYLGRMALSLLVTFLSVAMITSEISRGACACVKN